MRILMISDVYFPRINGVSTSIQTFKRELEIAGHEVYLIAPSYPEPMVDDDTILRIESRGVTLDPEDRMMKYRKLINQLPQLREKGFDLVHINTPFVAHYAGLTLARKLDIPCITTYHTLFEEYLYHYIPWIPKSVLRWAARSFSVSQCQALDGIITPSSIIASLLQQYGISNPIVTIPTGIDVSDFESGNGDKFRDSLGIEPHKKLLLNVSRVAYEKNIGRLLEVAQDLLKKSRDIHLVIAGEGPAKQSYIQQARDMGIADHVSFIGYLDRSTDLIDCYHSADLFVFSSKTETQGLVLLEAMAAGTPVVAIAEMGTKEVLQDGLGVKITDGTVSDFSAKIVEVLDQPDLHNTLSESAKLYAKDWDSSRLSARMAEYYVNITTQYPRELGSHA